MVLVFDLFDLDLDDEDADLVELWKRSHVSDMPLHIDEVCRS